MYLVQAFFMYTGHRKKTKTHAKTQFNQKIVKTEKFPWGTSSFIYDEYYDDYDLEKSISKKYMQKYIKVYNPALKITHLVRVTYDSQYFLNFT